MDIDIDSLDSLQFDGSEETAGSIGFQQGNTTAYLVQMVLDDDTVWRISHVDLDLLLHELGD